MYERTETTEDPEGWADAVLADRAWPGVQYVPGAIHPETAADVDPLGGSRSWSASRCYPHRPTSSVSGRLLGGELWVEQRHDSPRGAKWILATEARDRWQYGHRRYDAGKRSRRTIPLIDDAPVRLSGGRLVATIPASDNEFPRVIFVEGAAPGTPPSGMIYVYALSDSLLYWKDDTGTVHGPVSTGDLAAHIADTVDAHDASAISFAPAGTIAATTVQAAIEEVATEAGGGTPDLNDLATWIPPA